MRAPKGKFFDQRIVFYVAIFVGVLASKSLIHYWAAEDQVRSESGEWTDRFREAFVDQCQASILAKSDSNPTDKKSRIPAQIAPYLRYCQCLAGSVEKAKIIRTKFNPVTSSEEKYLKESKHSIQRYLASQQGQDNTLKCANQANLNSLAIRSDK